MRSSAGASRSWSAGTTSRPLRRHGRGGLEILDRERIDCVVLDLSLPDMSGYEFIEKVKGRDLGSGRRPSSSIRAAS